MSADNWTNCPKCVRKAVNDFDKLEQKFSKAYGVVTEEEYGRLSEKVAAGVPRVEQTLREDYDVGIFEGVFRFTYCASCTKCGFKFKHKVEPIGFTEDGDAIQNQ